jgi:hypothetical protein
MEYFLPPGKSEVPAMGPGDAPGLYTPNVDFPESRFLQISTPLCTHMLFSILHSRELVQINVTYIFFRIKYAEKHMCAE